MSVNANSFAVRHFWEKVLVGSEAECWEYQRSRYPDGYGHTVVSLGGGYSHRAAYELTYGPIPDGLSVLHHCDNPPCCNPAHLYAGTQAQNVADREARTYKNRKPTHGLRSTYAHYGCRCSACTKANSAASKAYKAKRRDLRLEAVAS